MRPADGVVIVRLGTAEFVDASSEIGCGLERAKAVEGKYFIKGALQRSFARGSIVTDNVIDQRIVEHL